MSAHHDCQLGHAPHQPHTLSGGKPSADKRCDGTCTGAADCRVPLHVHGCYADTRGNCDDPEDHR